MREGDLVAGRFRVEGLAGRGGMGEVHRAIDELRGERVALKIVSSPAFADRFEREAAVLAGLQHPGIVRYVAHGRTDDAHFIAMEWLEGEDLAHRLRRGPLEPAAALAMAARLADALAAVHARGVVHRDVKPENVFLVAGDLDAVRLVDFGIARGAADADERALTEHGALLGSPEYMSPEQARGDADVDARADVYGVGCVLFACLTGRPPFTGAHPLAVLCKVLLDEPPRASAFAAGIPEELDLLVERLLAKDRARRPADGAALGAAIRRDAPPSSRVAPRSLALGSLEQRLAFVVLVASPGLAARAGAAGDRVATVRRVAARSDARVEPLRDGSVVVVLSHRGVAIDRATEAAHLALALASAVPDAAVSLTTGRAVAGAAGTMGEAIDRASSLVAGGAGAGEVRADDVTGGLLAARFEMRSTTSGFVVAAVRAAARADRTLLGRPTPFVGRARELAATLASIGAAIRERTPRVVHVSSPSGGGKSRLRFEAMRRALVSHPTAQVWALWGEPASAATPLAAFAPMLRRVAGIADDEPGEARLHKLRACVARSLPPVEVSRVAEFLGEIAGVPFPDGASAPLRAARADRALFADQVGRAWRDFVAAELGAHPVVVVIEDAHWVDRRTFDMVDLAIATARDRGLPLVVLVFGRAEPAHGAGTLGEAPDLALALGELDLEATAELVRATLGDVGPARVAALRERAAGNPFHLEELLRAEAEGRAAHVGDSALALAELRLSALDAEARRVARAASILGGSFASSALPGMVDLDEAQVEAHLASLASAEVLGAPHERGDAWTFRHATFREAAYAMLTAEDRALGHRLAAEHLARTAGADPAAIAAHLERGGATPRAVSWHHAAAVHARDRNDAEALHHHVERAMACGASGAICGDLLVLRAEAKRWRSDHVSAAQLAIMALPLLEADGETWFAAASEAMMALGRLGRSDDVLALGRRVLDASRRATPSVPVVAALARTHEQLVFLGRYELAKELTAVLFPLAAPLAGDPVAATWLLFARADAALVVDDRGLYVELMQALVEAFDAVGDVRSALLQRSNLADAYLNVGLAEAAASLCRQTLGAPPGLVSPHAATAAKLNLARALARLDDLDASADLARDVLVEARALEGLRLRTFAHYSLAEIQLLRGDPRAAQSTLRDALSHPEIPAPLRAILETRLAEAHLALGEVPAARGLSLGAMKILFELRAVEEGELYIRRIHAEVLAASGQIEAARETIRDARERLLAASRRVAPRWLPGYLHGVPDHARALALAEAWRV